MSVHRETFTAFVKAQGFTRGAELGVDKGILFGMLLRECPDLFLLGVDTFPDRQRSHRAFELAAAYQERAHLYEVETADACDAVPYQSLDFVFIDAAHDYASVVEDIACWLPKVRKGGWLGGHDYHVRKFPGVVKAVHHIFGGKHHEMPGTIWGMWC